MTVDLRTGALLFAALGSSGCGAWEGQAQARDRARTVLSCPDIELTPQGGAVWVARGCGRQAAIACTTGGNEPRCVQVRLAGMPADPNSGSAPDEVEGASPSGEQALAEAARPDGSDLATEPSPLVVADAPGVSPASPGPAASVTSPSFEAPVRAELDAHRDDILACAPVPRVLVRARWTAPGPVALTLEGALSGSAEERCVQAALGALAAPEGTGDLLHLVRAR